MSISFTDDTLAIWYILLEPEKSDYMGALSRRDYGFMYTWRIRYYHSLDPWDEKDVKRWYSLQIPSAVGDTEGAVDVVREMVAATLALARMVGKPEPAEIYELIRGAKSFDEFTKEFMEAPFVHKQEVTRQ